MRACHAAGPGSIPGRDKFPGWGFSRGFSSPVKQMSGRFRSQGPRIPFGHHYHLSSFITGANDLRCWRALKNLKYTYCGRERLYHIVPCLGGSISQRQGKCSSMLFSNYSSRAVCSKIGTTSRCGWHPSSPWCSSCWSRLLLITKTMWLLQKCFLCC